MEKELREMYWHGGILLKVKLPVTYEMGGFVLREFSSDEK